ncbi:tubulin tyrosine ligase-like protein [Aureococcus anophagefferens]|uniref:Tubulin--tyrosine ligase-like protein 5 n=1 Tax=Aureococcus anophagefferens TaxID=44056 RepID=A0ABR1G251_AURAN
MEYLGSLLGMGDKAAEDKGRERKVSIPTQLAWCARVVDEAPGPGDLRDAEPRYQRVNHFPGSCRPRRPAAAASASCRRARRERARPKDKKLVAQRYLDAPFVAINGRKFDLRMYCLVTSLDPLVAYVHAEGLVRFSTHQYTMRNLRCRYVHLTNYSVNKKSRRYVEADDEPVGDDLDDDDDDDDDEPPPVRALIVKTLIAAESEMTPASYRACGASVRPPGAPVPGKRPCFELFGFDILLDADLKPWIIEVNISPSLMGNSALDRHIKGRLMADVFHTTGFEPYSPARVKRDRKAARARALDKSRHSDKSDKAGAKGNQDAWRRSGRPDDIALDKLSGEDWDLVCHAEDELGARRRAASRAPCPARRARPRTPRPPAPRVATSRTGPARAPRATAKSEAAASYRRDRAPRPSQKSSDADHFRIVDDFSWQQLEDFSWQNLFDGAADDGDPGEEGAKFSQSQKVPAAEQPPRRRNRPDSADRARAPRRSSNRDAGPRQSVANAAAGKPPRW